MNRDVVCYQRLAAPLNPHRSIFLNVYAQAINDSGKQHHKNICQGHGKGRE